MTEVQKAQRRLKAVWAVRRSTELEGSRSTKATGVDHWQPARPTAAVLLYGGTRPWPAGDIV